MTDNHVTLAESEPRFWSKVDIRSADECWPWKASLGSTGYGQYRSDAGVTVKAHRHAVGARPLQVVMHTCDNPPCCNPAHLQIGTVQDNVQDMVNKGRHLVPRRLPVGEANQRSKVSDADVVEMRHRASQGETYRALADHYGLVVTTVARIVSGRGWAHVGGPITKKAVGRPRKNKETKHD